MVAKKKRERKTATAKGAAGKTAGKAKNINEGVEEIVTPTGDEVTRKPRLKGKIYWEEQARLHHELVKLQYWVIKKGLRVVLIFEGRDAAGKGGAIKRITEPLNPRGARVVALGTASDREKTQWYFQRFIAHLPAAGEIVLFDRSWYNRAGVERVFGFCTDAEYKEFLRSCPEFERMLVHSGIILLKYWFSVSYEEQERRFQKRAQDPDKRWKLSNIDLEGRERWVEYSKAKDEMFFYTNIPEAPWHTVDSEDQRRARLNCMAHILESIPYKNVIPKPMKLPHRKQLVSDYHRPPKSKELIVPDRY
ncbi:MAG: polyphosphate kinase 2 [Candidatus Handelsmanbacteria bacterium]|nr:polyphosphate kinase 2 [Candidatus Handelsmanbacteria bacterium]